MEIRLGRLLAGAKNAEGTVVIIDVYRAFTTAAVAFLQGAKKIVLVADVDEALALRERGVGCWCVGEVDGKRPEGFDFGNSPHELSKVDATGRTLILSTRAGTVGVAAATRAERVYCGSLVVAGATVRAILRDAPEVVTLVAMGWAARRRTDEDEQCALYVRNVLRGLQPDPEAVKNVILNASESQKFVDERQPHFHPEDREIALDIDRAPFAIRITREAERLVARPDPV